MAQTVKRPASRRDISDQPSQAEGFTAPQPMPPAVKIEFPQISTENILPITANYYPIPLSGVTWIVKMNALNLLKVGEKAVSYPAILLFGPPGIGKSTAIREVVNDIAMSQGMIPVDISDATMQKTLYNIVSTCEKTYRTLTEIRECIKTQMGGKHPYVFLDLRLTEVEPQDLLGLPTKTQEGGVMEYAPPMWAKILKYIPGILFLDELSNVERPDVLAASYKIILDRAAGFTKFDPRTLVVAAGNLPKHAPELARSLPLPLINRSLVLHVAPPSHEEWYEWTKERLFKMYADDPARLGEHIKTLDIVYGVLKTFDRESSLFIPRARQGDINENAPSPRAWSHFVFTTPFSLLQSMKNPSVIQSYIAGYVGIDAASKILPIIKTGIKLDIEKILANPESEIWNLVEDAKKIETDHEELRDEKASILIILATLLSNKIVFARIPASEKAQLAERVARALYNIASSEYNPGIGESVLKAFEQALVTGYIYLKKNYEKYKGDMKLGEWIRNITTEENAILERLGAIRKTREKTGR